MALPLPHADPVRRISVVPRSIGSLSYAMQLPHRHRCLLTETELDGRIFVPLGGRVAEDFMIYNYNGIFFAGANDDLDLIASALGKQGTRKRREFRNYSRWIIASAPATRSPLDAGVGYLQGPAAPGRAAAGEGERA